MCAGWGGGGGEDEACGVGECAEENGAAITEFLGDGGKDRLADSPSEVLDRDGEREFGAEQAELACDGDLEHAKRRADGKARHQDQTGCDQDGCEHFRLCRHCRASDCGGTRKLLGNKNKEHAQAQGFIVDDHPNGYL